MLDLLSVLRRSDRARIEGDPRVLIVGSGIGGLTIAYRLRRAGVRSFQILEKGDDVGGTWRDNRYPGVACDIPSHLYTLTYFRNPGWTQLNAPGAEIHDYLRRLARRFDIYRHVRFGREVVRCTYDDCQWRVETRDGATERADVLITASGFLHVPHVPRIEGLETFAGVVTHNSHWHDGIRVDGHRVAIVGTGSSGVQLAPAIVDRVAKLEVFQRTPQWIFPLPNEQYGAADRLKRRLMPWRPAQIYDRYLQEFNGGLGQAVMGDAALQQVFHDACAKFLATVRDPELRRRLTPDYPVLCKRLVFSEKFYAAVQHPRCELVTEAIERIEPRGIRTRDGRLHELDLIVLATGFRTHEYCRPLGIRGEGGLALEEAWASSAHSFEATSLAGFPNFFMLGGPQTTIGNLSYTACAELQASYIVRALQMRAERRARAIVPTREAQQRFLDDMHGSARRTVWLAGCASWYVDGAGRLDIWPKSADDFVAMIEKGPQPQDFRWIS
jgi:cation diffusion facilitator CzcD-associated flavoprotein CzcO